MSFNNQYEHDIFLSYARVDNLSSEEEGWVDLFYKSLQYAIDRKVGKANGVKIWRDTRQVDGSQLFDRTIEEALSNSAVLLCLLSPGYLESSYCQGELKYFHTSASKDTFGLYIDDRNRIVYVRLDKIARESIPEELGRSTGFDFHDTEDPSDHVDPYDITDQAAKEIIKHVSNALVKTLREMSGQLEPEGGSQDQQDEGFSIFLADVPEELAKLKYRTSQYLSKKGFQIIENIPPPFDHEEHDTLVASHLKEVDLSIHLFGESAGKTIDDIPDETVSFPQRQANVAFKHAKNQLIWTPNDLHLGNVVDTSHKTFLEQLETKKERDYQLIKGQRSTLEQDIADLIEHLKEKERESATFDRPHILLDTHIKDQLFASDINLQLLRSNIQPFLNPQEDDPTENLSLLAEMMKKINRIVFIYGEISKDWLLGRMSEALKLIVTHDFPVEDFTVFMVPPKKDPEDVTMKQKFMSINIIDNSTSRMIDPTNLRGLVGA